MIDQAQLGDLYHGTAQRFGPGQQIEPGHPSNYPGITADTNSGHVFATNDLTEAWHHAKNASDRAGNQKYWRGNMSPEDQGMDESEAHEYGLRPVYQSKPPRVYGVQFTGHAEMDQENKNQGFTDPIPAVERGEQEPPDDYDPGRAFQSKQPLKVTTGNQAKAAQRENIDTFGADL